MESNHIIVTDLYNGYVHLVAENSYQLVLTLLNRVVSEAVVKPERVKDFKAEVK